MRILNRKANFNYRIIETLEAGVVLSGAEVKSIRAGRVDLSQAFVKIHNGQVFLKNAYIYPYFGQLQNYNPRQDRKLLLHKKQINYLQGKMSGLASTVIPLELYTAHNLIKAKIALAVSKKKFDKKAAIKTRDELRRVEQEL